MKHRKGKPKLVNVDRTVEVALIEEDHAIKGQSFGSKWFLMKLQCRPYAAVEDGGWWVEVAGWCKYLGAL